MEEMNGDFKNRSLEDIQADIEKRKAELNNETTNGGKNASLQLSSTNTSNLTVSKDNDTILTLKNETLNKIQKDFVEGRVDADEGVKQLVNVLTIVNATEDEKLRNSLQKEASKSLKDYMRGLKYKDQEKKI